MNVPEGEAVRPRGEVVRDRGTHEARVVVLSPAGRVDCDVAGIKV